VERVPYKRTVQFGPIRNGCTRDAEHDDRHYTLEEDEDGVTVVVHQKGIPEPIPEEDAATGWEMSSGNLARLVEFPEAK
jgi:hypothetical protein